MTPPATTSLACFYHPPPPHHTPHTHRHTHIVFARGAVKAASATTNMIEYIFRCVYKSYIDTSPPPSLLPGVPGVLSTVTTTALPLGVLPLQLLAPLPVAPSSPPLLLLLSLLLLLWHFSVTCRGSHQGAPGPAVGVGTCSARTC